MLGHDGWMVAGQAVPNDDHALGEQPEVGQQLTQGFADVGAVGDHVNSAVTPRHGDEPDQFLGQRGLGRPARVPEPGQHGQRDRPFEERQLNDDRGNDAGVASGEFVLTRGDLSGAVVGPARGPYFPAMPAEQVVVHGESDRGASGHKPTDDQTQHD